MRSILKKKKKKESESQYCGALNGIYTLPLPTDNSLTNGGLAFKAKDPKVVNHTLPILHYLLCNQPLSILNHLFTSSLHIPNLPFLTFLVSLPQNPFLYMFISNGYQDFHGFLHANLIIILSSLHPHQINHTHIQLQSRDEILEYPPNQ